MIKYISERGGGMKRYISPYLIIIGSFLMLILAGAILLLLPVSLKDNQSISFVDSLFVSTSAVTITGLSTVNLYETFNVFGKIVIAILIQIGGLSVTTFAVFILTIIGSKLSIGSRELAKESINVDSIKGIIKVVKNVVAIAFIFELIGTIVFTTIFMVEGNSFFNSLGLAAFHSIASYNNSGFDIFVYGNSLMHYSSNVVFNLMTVVLIVMGGLGAIVVFDVIEKKRWKKFSFHTRIVLKMTLILLLLGAASFMVLEKNVSIIQAIFHSVTLRTAGFYTHDYSTISNATRIIMIIFMYIGGAPASTAGGIKVTAVYTLYKAGTSYIRKQEPVSYNRKIPVSYQLKALMIFMLSFVIIVIALITLTITEKNVRTSSLLFELISAITNTGLTENLTMILSTLSKIILIVLMFIGRIGIMTLINYFVPKKEVKNIDYIDINYII